MVNIKKSQSAWMREWISKFPDGIYTTNDKIIFCQPCNHQVKCVFLHYNNQQKQQVHCSKYSHLKQHNESKKLDGARGEIGEKMRRKFVKVRDRNPGLGELIDIAKVLNGQQAEIEMAPNMVAAMKFAPLQSCDVERSFSVYKNILADNRTNFTPENLEMYLICNCEKRA
jgi:hypothetical protein